jgi:hypothetical protein
MEFCILLIRRDETIKITIPFNITMGIIVLVMVPNGYDIYLPARLNLLF